MKNSMDDLKLDSIEKLLEIRKTNEGIETKQIMKMVEQILYPSGNEWVAERTKPHNGEAVPVLDTESAAKYITARGDYSDRWDIVGKYSKYSRNSTRLDNPWGVKLGRYSKCPHCKQVCIEGIKLDANKGLNVTYLKHVFKHHDGTCHTDALVRVNRLATYEELAQLKMENKI